MTHPMARRLRITGMHRRQTTPIYRVTQCLGHRHTAEVPAHEIAATVSVWLAELGADSPLVDDLARAVRNGDWSSARELGDYLSVDVAMAARADPPKGFAEKCKTDGRPLLLPVRATQPEPRPLTRSKK